MTRRDLMRLHVEALFTHDTHGDLVAVNEPHGSPAPRFFVGRTEDGIILRFRCDVDVELRHELEAAARSHLLDKRLDEPCDTTRYSVILGRSAPVEHVWAGPAFCFPVALSESTRAAHITAITEANTDLLASHFQDWMRDVARCQPMLGMLVDGNVVSLCCSVRRTELADEAGVETAVPYRGRGYASHVTVAWADAVRKHDRVPLYSTSWANASSRAVALKAGLLLIGADLHFT